MAVALEAEGPPAAGETHPQATVRPAHRRPAPPVVRCHRPTPGHRPRAFSSATDAPSARHRPPRRTRSQTEPRRHRPSGAKEEARSTQNPPAAPAGRATRIARSGPQPMHATLVHSAGQHAAATAPCSLPSAAYPPVLCFDPMSSATRPFASPLSMDYRPSAPYSPHSNVPF
ncbi:hypothetical protein B7P02_15660 [Bordetella bronchiseptica]|nr:hypothetical protein B7P02_15660 [Bordetella bronchiseptica]